MTILEIPYKYITRQHFPISQTLHLDYKKYLRVKRILDVLFCIVLIPILFIPALLIMLMIVIDSPGNPVFVQERVGYRGRKFWIYKFRTLWADYDDVENKKFMKAYINGEVGDTAGSDRLAKFKPLTNNDVTKVGRFLRKTSLDELPQLINVLKGEMTLVGPRPNVLWEVDAYKPWHHERLFVQPGLTGLAQVLGRSDLSFDNIVRYDIQYAKNQSIHMDFWIMFQTAAAILDRKGAG